LFSLVIAAVVLGGAVTAAAIMGSPYETLKYAALDALTERNATVDGAATLTVNGVQLENAKTYSIQGDKSFFEYMFDDEGNNIGFSYSTNSLSVTSLGFAMGDGKQWYAANVYPNDQHNYSGRSMASFFSGEERNSAAMRFFELLADTVIGDLKNNITMTSENGVRRIQGTLTESQVPEIVKAGLDMLIEQSSGNDWGSNEVSFDGRVYVYEDYTINGGIKSVTVFRQQVIPMTAEERENWDNGTFYENLVKEDFWGITHIGGVPYIADGERIVVDEYNAPTTADDYSDYEDGDWYEIPVKSMAIKYVHGEADVDKDGNLLRVDVSGTCTVTDVFGKTSEVEVKVAASFSDIGTSDPACPIPGAEQLLTPEFVYSLFGNERMCVYFTLNEDGSIDESSVTTAHPRWSPGASGYAPVPPGPPMAAAAADAPAYPYAVDAPSAYEVTTIVPAVPDVPEMPDLDW